MPVNSNGVGAYDEMRNAGRLKIVKRTEGVSTTDFIGRLLTLSKEHLINARGPSSPQLVSNVVQDVNISPSPCPSPIEDGDDLSNNRNSELELEAEDKK